MNKRVEAQIEKIYKAVFNKIFTRKRLKEAMHGNRLQITNAAITLEQSKAYDRFCRDFSKKLASQSLNKQRSIWKKYYEAAKKSHYIVLPSTYKEFEKKLFAKAITHNFTMIKSVPQHILKVYEQKDISTLIKGVAEGSVGRKEFETQLKSHGYKNAKLIARTETAKLQTTIDEYGATSLGSVVYQWLSSKDKRTRPSHRAMDGVIVFWRPQNEKPILDKMQGNAGEFPNCRCTTIALFDEDDLKDSTYKVYDYRQFKIVTMSRKKLLESIKKGSL